MRGHHYRREERFHFFSESLVAAAGFVQKRRSPALLRRQATTTAQIRKRPLQELNAIPPKSPKYWSKMFRQVVIRGSSMARFGSQIQKKGRIQKAWGNRFDLAL